MLWLLQLLLVWAFTLDVINMAFAVLCFFCGLWRLAKALRAGRVPDPFGAGIPINTKRPEHDLGPFIHSMIEPQILFVGAHPRRTFVRKGRQSRARVGLCVHDTSQDRFGIGAVHGRHVLDMTDP